MSGAEVVRGLSWDHPRGRDPVLATSDAWHRAHPDVRLEWTPRSLADFAGGGLDGLVGAYDLVCIDHPVIGEAVERGWIVPLDDLVPHDVLERLTLGSVDGWSGAYRHDGRTYAVPVDAAALTAASRPDLLERNGLAAPGTFGELLDLARTSGRVAVPLSVFGTVALFASLCAQLGEELFAAGPGLVGAEVGHQALGLMTELAKAVPDQCFDDGAAQLLERLSGTDDLAYVGYAYGYSTYARAGGGRRRVTFAGAPPVVRGTSPRPTLGGVGLAVLRDAPQTEAAVTYARWVAADDCQRGLWTRSGGQPAARAAWTDPELDELCGGFFSTTRRSLEQAYVRPGTAWFATVQPVVGAWIRAFLRDGARDAGDLLAELDVLVADHRSRA